MPAQLATLLDAGADAALRLFDAILVGGQATPRILLDRAEATGLRIVRTYGSSETSGGCVYDGVPVGATRAGIVDGQLELSGPTLAEYYLGDPERTAAAFVERDGTRWYRTGDAGSIGPDGRVTVTGRLDDVIISGGEKVSLAVVERAVREVPGFSEAVVVRAASERWGEVPVVVVGSDRAEEPGVLAILRTAVAEVAGRAARPDRVVGVESLPLLASGKPDRVAADVHSSGDGVDGAGVVDLAGVDARDGADGLDGAAGVHEAGGLDDETPVSGDEQGS